MARYYIESVRYDALGGGPFVGIVVAEAKIRTDEGETFYLSMAEVEGLPNFYRSDKSLYDVHLNMDEDAAQMIEPYFMETGEYEEIFKHSEREDYDLLRFMIYVVRADWDACEVFCKNAEGKYLDEITVPRTDVEEDYLFEIGELTEDELTY